MDAPIEDEPGQGEASHFAPHGIEAGKDNCLRCIVDDEIYAGSGLEGANVASLAANDTPFHFVVGQRYDRDNRLGYLVGGAALDGEGDDLARAAVGLLACPLFNQSHALRGFGAYLGFNAV